MSPSKDKPQRWRLLGLIERAQHRYMRRASRVVTIGQQYQAVYGRFPGPGSKVWAFRDIWSGRWTRMSYEEALHLEQEAFMLLNRLHLIGRQTT
jgi:hypothetical protein